MYYSYVITALGDEVTKKTYKPFNARQDIVLSKQCQWPEGGDLMTNSLFLEATTEYREIRHPRHGDELRWLVSRTQIFDPASGQILTRSFIRHPGVCVIVPFLSEDKIVLLRQYRHAVNEELWELPAGTLAGREEDQRVVATEAPESCAARELREETGYAAMRLEKFAECYAVPGSGDELMHFFFAYELQLRAQSLDLGEAICAVKAFRRAEIETMIERSEIRDAKTLVGLFYALRRTS
jgi:ADP-ribose pyrophosphatase